MPVCASSSASVGKLKIGRLGLLKNMPRLGLLGSVPRAPPSRGLPRDLARRSRRVRAPDVAPSTSKSLSHCVIASDPPESKTAMIRWLSLIRRAKKRKAASKRAVTSPWVPFTVSLSVSFVYKSMNDCFRASLPSNRATLCNGDPMEVPCRRGHRGGALRGRGDLL
ncbi:hypothetical protein B296_00047323 [Ensete ventricosum]|uniref:Uncharacterized protein n=1 Tax=Ensete ventricosum TaxID=4639 RepID=A0A426Z0B9_ENSVE|nr:hypothetical protein B296_00047323 [Ensete ventricosum]